MSEPAGLARDVPAAMGDQADGLRRLFGALPLTLTVAAREAEVIEAYARIKRAAREQGCRCFRIAVSHARTPEEAWAVFDNLQRVVHEYLGVRLEYLGMADGRPGAATAAFGAGRPGAVPHDSVL